MHERDELRMRAIDASEPSAPPHPRASATYVVSKDMQPSH
jgi:hypothetical protein